MATTKRSGKPYFYVTWLSGLLVGNNSCRFAAWIRGHYAIDKRPSDFNFAAWKIDHTALIQKTLAELRADGWSTTVEDQNSFKLSGNAAIIGGKPDIVARKGKRVRVVDAKTGHEDDKNSAQVAIYMILLPMVYPDRFDFEQMEGAVVYKGASAVSVPLESVRPMRERLFQMIRELADEAKPEAVPSEKECRFCDVTATDCPVRFGEGAAVAVGTSEF